jgi:hypothetical protein
VDIVKATISWDGPDHDVLYVFVEPTPKWGVTWDDFPDDEIISSVAVLRELDDNDEPIGRVAGIEILDFLRFERWDAMPCLPLLWQVPGSEPLPLVDLLQRLQAELHGQARLANVTSRGPRAE